MTLRLVPEPEYSGQAGVMAMRSMQQALTQALAQEDWARISHLDRICTLLTDKVIAANRDDKAMLICALSELKGVYANLIAQCQQEVTLLHAT
jgi:flagellar protein FliT